MSSLYKEIKRRYEVWRENALQDPELVQELEEMAGNPDKITDAFYQNLSFGTGGLRGVIGAGTNRMNIYTVGKASQGLADYINRNFYGRTAGLQSAMTAGSKVLCLPDGRQRFLRPMGSMFLYTVN